jgi:sugar-specific transcriptional regulator TrmB
MYEEILETLGLTKSEIYCYMALLDLGPSTTGPLIKHSKIASGKAYLILDKLMKKGLVTYSIISGTKNYQAKNPERLFDYLNEKKEELNQIEAELNKIIPKLKEKFSVQKNQTKAEIFEGVQGFKTFHKFMLDECNKGDTIYVFGAPKEANEKFGSYYIQWNNKRVEKGIKLKILYSLDSRKFGEVRKKLPLTEVRYMDEKKEIPAWIDVFGNYVTTINVHGNPICFLIKDKISQESYLKYFNTIWDRAKK